jgi:PKD repeat protein
MAPLSVQFTDESKGIGLISWSWDFNNDKVVDSIEQNPVYTFANPGNYTVSLAVKGNGGTTTTTRVDYIIVSAVPPQHLRLNSLASRPAARHLLS